MDVTSLFLIFPETHPSNQWMRSNGDHQSEEGINKYVYGLNLLLQETDIENFEGYYDKENVENFLEDFDILEDYYPQPARRLLISTIVQFNDWRESMFQNANTNYSIFAQAIVDHTFCEAAHRKKDNSNNTYVIINQFAHSLANSFDILVNEDSIKIDSVENPIEASEWFIKNRKPERKFHISPKHGENRQETYIIKNKIISPLRCSEHEAKQFLTEALGEYIYELFAYDNERENYLVFKFEGHNPQNLYHGYHVPMDSDEVPEQIKRKLLRRHKRKSRT